MGASPGEAGALVYAYADGAFALRPESDGAFWSLDAPVVLVTAYGAQAYAAWYAARTGKPWRLVDEMEREKAARGVDGRLYPWGDHFDPSWTTMRDSHAGKPRSAEVRACPEDESVYGVRGVAGNVLDWTCSAYVPAGATADGEAHAVVVTEGAGRRVARGGSWNDAASSARCATRYNIDATIRLNFVSFRLARSLP
jgi:serine/threonine-protein kinase